jgi:uncharacterized protein (DUF2384 family)
MNQTRFEKFEDLPSWVTERVRRFRPKDAETWVFDPVPALENRSVMELMNRDETGRNQVRRYLNDLMGKFFPGE